MTEKTIQNALTRDLVLKKHELIVPNVSLFPWEADLISVSSSGLITEYEIKISKSDFKADSKKVAKHKTLEGDEHVSKKGRMLKPSYFMYVMPKGMIPLDDIPAYAGLIEIDEHGLKLRRKSPRHHRLKVALNQRKFLGRGLMYRYWKTRINPSKS